MYALFFHWDGDYECNGGEVFLAIFPTKDEAETALLKRIEIAEDIKVKSQQFQNECQRIRREAKGDWRSSLDVLVREWRVWLTNLGVHYESDFPNPDLNYYDIREIEFGKFYDF